MKFKPSDNVQPSQEFILAALFGMFILPWLFIAGIMTIATIIEKIEQYKDKKDPSRKLDRLIRWLKSGVTEDMFQDYDEDDGTKFDVVDFSKVKGKYSFPVKDMPDYDDLTSKWTKWAQCVAEIASISEMKDSGKQIQKIFSKYFTNKDLFTRESNGVKYTGLRVIVRDTSYPNDKWFKPKVVENAINELDKTGMSLAAAVEKMSAKIKVCLEAPKTHKDDKEYLLGCLNYISTIDKVVSISTDLMGYIQDASDACITAWRKLTV